MAYTGDVASGGPPDVRNLPGLRITKASVGPMENNAYLLRCTVTGEQLLIDAANEAPKLLALAGAGGLATIVTTHGHQDHWMALSDVVAATGARVVAHPADAEVLPVRAEPVYHGDQVRVGEAVLNVIHLVGHTPGSIALLYLDSAPGGIPHLFTGDSLFPGGVGNTHGNPRDFQTLIDDVQHKIFDELPDETWFYPGHGRDSTLGAQRPSIPEWRARGW